MNQAVREKDINMADMATKRPMSAEITAELLDAFNLYVSQNRYIKYRAIEAAFKLFMAAPETLQLKLMRDDSIMADIDVKYEEKPGSGNSKRKKLSVDVTGDSSSKVAVDKVELEKMIKQVVKEQAKTTK